MELFQVNSIRGVAMEPANGAYIHLLHGSEKNPRTRLLVVTVDDPIYVIEFFKVFFAELPSREFDLRAVVIEKPFHESTYQSLQRIARLYGIWGAGRQGLRFLAARLRGRSIAQLCGDHDVKVIPIRSVNDSEFIRLVREMDVDIITSVASPEIFGSELLSLPHIACVNIHSGRLPRYRGMLPTFWQMHQGESEVTITVHRMAVRLDAGDVLGTRSVPLRANDTLDRVIRSTKQEGARLMIEILRDLRGGKTRATPLDMAQAGYFTFPRQADVRAFKRRGHKLL